MLVERLGAAGSRRRRRCEEHQDHDAGRSEAIVSEGDGFSRRLMRIGNGYDLHRLVAGRPLILARRHDSIRARARRAFGRRHRLSRGDGRDPRRRRCRRHRPDVSRHRSEMERRQQHRAAERRGREDCASRLRGVERGRDGDRAEAEAAAVSRCDARESRRGARHRCRRRQRQRKDERKRRQHGPWRIHGVPCCRVNCEPELQLQSL